MDEWVTQVTLTYAGFGLEFSKRSSCFAQICCKQDFSQYAQCTSKI